MRKFQRGDQVVKSGYLGVVTGEYLPGMYEVRLERGEVVVPGSELFEPHPEYGAGVWTSEECKREALGLDASQPLGQLVKQVVEVLERHGYDSIDRELAFWHYSQVTGREYNDLYDAWLASDL